MKTLFTLIFSALVPFTFFSQEYSWLDQSFGVSGYAHQPSDNGDTRIIDCELNDNGEIISLFRGPETQSYDICKLKANGLPDITFGNAGKVVASIDIGGEVAGYVDAQVMTLDKTGRILVSGRMGLDYPNGIFVQRYLPTGELDIFFGANGTVISNIPEMLEYYVQDIQTNETGRIVVGGGVGLVDNELYLKWESILWCFDIDGLPIESFDSDGILIINESSQIITTLALEEGGDILIGFEWTNYYLESSPHLSIVKRVFADGSFDESFGNSNALSEFNPYPQLTQYEHGYPQRIMVNDEGNIFVLSIYLEIPFWNDDFIHAILYGLDEWGNPLPEIPNGIDLSLLGGEAFWVTDFAFLGDDIIAFSGSKGARPSGEIYSGYYPQNSFFVGAIQTDGGFVEGFGVNGVILTDTGEEHADIYSAVRIQDQDKIIAGGCSGGDGLVGRYTLEGYVSNEELIKSNLNIYPNPADDLIVVQMDDKRATGEINLYALDGRLVMSQRIQNENTVYLKIDQLESGVYVLKYGDFVQRIEVL